MLDRIVFASTNKGKIREVKQLFSRINIEIVAVSEDFSVVEDGETFKDNAIIKAKKAASFMNLVVIADDSGLIVDALDGKPGVHSSRYAKTDQERIQKLLNAMKEVKDPLRTARFICSTVLMTPGGKLLHSSEGTCEGKIITKPLGCDGFGFDPVFYIPELALTMAEIPLEKKNTISHRAKAFNKMLEWIMNNKLAINL